MQRFNGLGRSLHVPPSSSGQKRSSSASDGARSRKHQQAQLSTQMQFALGGSAAPQTPESSAASSISACTPCNGMLIHPDMNRQYTCASCEDFCTFNGSRSYSKGAVDSRQCLPYQNILQAITRHSVVNPALGISFKRKTEEGRQDYLRDQKRRRLEKMKTGNAAASCVPYDFSDLTGTQVQTSKAEDIFDINTRWTTFRTWF